MADNKVDLGLYQIYHLHVDLRLSKDTVQDTDNDTE